MNNESESLQSHLAKARGLGSAHEGALHWLHERVSGAILVPLMLWLVWSIAGMYGRDYESFTMWLSQPVNTILMISAVLAVFYHTAMGIQVVIEDYIHNEGVKMVSLVLNRVVFAFLAIACLFSILKISLIAM